jgi:predicted permease
MVDHRKASRLKELLRKPTTEIADDECPARIHICHQNETNGNPEPMKLSNDLRVAWRALRVRPTFFATAVLTLALGIGAVAAIFTVYDAVLLKPLPFVEADRIVRVMRDQPPVTHSPVSPPVFREWQERSGEVFDAFGAFVESAVNLSGTGDADRLTAYSVTPGFWNVFGQPLALGRAFGDEEETGNERVVVISDSLWRDRFGAAPDVLGRDIMLNGESWRVIGVTRPGIRYPASAQLWMPTFLPGNTMDRGGNSLSVVARLREGVSLPQAITAMDGIVQWQVAAFPENHRGLSVRMEPLQQLVTSRVREPLGMLILAAGLVLLIACANLANLMLARGQAREQELALRSALGASRGRLVRQVLAESLLIALAGAAAGVLAAQPAVNGLLALAPNLLPIYNVPAVDLRVIAVTAIVALGTLLLFGMVPAWRAAGADPVQAMQGASRSQTGSRRQMRARAVLVSAEIALAVTLLAGAGLLIDSLRRLGEVDSGISSAQVLTARLSLPIPAMLPGEEFMAWYERLDSVIPARLDAIETRLRGLPGVDSIALTDRLPASGDTGWNGGIEIAGQEPNPTAIAEFRFVNPDYFRTFGIPVKAGRGFDTTDGLQASGPTEILVNQTFMDRYMTGADPLGREITVLFGDAKPVIGVVGDVRQAGLDRAPDAEVYFPIRRAAGGELALAIKVQGDAAAHVEPLRSAMREIAPDVPVYSIRTMDEVTDATLRMRQFNMTLMSAFAAVALLLAAIGLYGVIAYSVGQRQREIGVRQAIGARRGDIHRLMLGAGLRMVVPGVIAGLLGAFALGRLIASQLYGVGSADPLVLGSVVVMLAAVAMAACAIPTLRAARVPPMEALRSE